MPSSGAPNRSTASADGRLFRVSVACAGGDGTVHVIELAVPEGATLEDVILKSEILRRCPDLDLAEVEVGVFNRIRSLADRVRDGDRVEIYRPLRADPKESRRRRARAARKGTG